MVILFILSPNMSMMGSQSPNKRTAREIPHGAPTRSFGDSHRGVLLNKVLFSLAKKNPKLYLVNAHSILITK